MPELTQEQNTAASVLDRALGVVAAAGSGKTTVLVERYVNLIQLSLQPQEILTVTFTNEAANEMKERIASRLSHFAYLKPGVAQAVSHSRNIGTIHSFCYRVLSQFGSILGLEPLKEIISPLELASRFEKHYQAWMEALDQKDLNFLLSYFSQREIYLLAKLGFQQRRVFQSSMTKLSSDEEPVYQKPDKTLLLGINRLFSPFFQKLEKNLLEDGLYGFDDLEWYTLCILKQSEPTREHFQQQFRAILVDEFQDTSPQQNEILEILSADNPSKFFMVGDPKQSIYRFRQADVNLFIQTSEKILKQDGMITELNTNFRSSPRLLEKLNSISADLFDESDVVFEPMTTPVEMDADDPQPSIFVERYECEKRTEAPAIEQGLVAEKIRQMIDAGIEPSDITLLFRVSDRISQFEKALKEKEVPTSCQKTQQLFRIYDVLDIVNYLKAVQNPLDDFYLSAFLRSRFVGISYQELADICLREGKSLFDKCLLDPPSRLVWFIELLEAGTLKVDRLLSVLFQSTSYWPQQSDALLYLLSGLCKDNWTVYDAIEHIDAWAKESVVLASNPSTSNPNSVRLLTVHAAKGLEFKHVFLVDCLRQSPRGTPPMRLSPGFLPGVRYYQDGDTVCSDTYDILKNKEAEEDREEAKRILYVAITRAKDKLYAFLPKNEKLIPKNSWAAQLLKST